MTKRFKIAIIVLLVASVALLTVKAFSAHNAPGIELFSSPEKFIAESLSDRKTSVSPGDIAVIAKTAGGKDAVFIFKYGGRTMSAMCSKMLVGDRYAVVCGELSNVDIDSDDPSYDPAQPINFRLSGYTTSELYSYQDGRFTLKSTTNQLNEELKDAAIRVVAVLVIFGFTVFSKTKKEDE